MKKTFKIINLHCANCGSKISENLQKLPEVKGVSLNFYSSEITIEFQTELYSSETLGEFINKVNKICDKIEPGTFIKEEEEFEISPTPSDATELFFSEEGDHEDNQDDTHHHSHSNNRKIKTSHLSFKEKVENFMAFSGVLIAFALFIVAFFISKPEIKYSLLFIAYILSGGDIVLKSFKNIKRGNFLDENFLMTIATFGAFALGDYSESVAVMIFYKIGEYFQERAVQNSKKSIENLLNLKATYGNLLLENGEIIKLTPEKFKIGDTLVVKKGEKIPLDGVLLSKNAVLDNSSLTGESLPVEAQIGDSILSGSINLGDTFTFKVEKLFKDSTVNKIIELVKNANANKPKAEKFVTKFARVYTPIVVFLALFIAIVPPFFSAETFATWFGRALIFLVISCPCALVLSIPLTFFSSIGYASKNGILIKSGNFLEILSKVDTIIFDKTGTLTSGKFSVTEIIPQSGYTSDEILTLAQSGEYYSNHPIARGILAVESKEFQPKKISEHREFSGKGLWAKYCGDEVLVGSYKFLLEMNVENLDENIISEENSSTGVYISKNGKFIGKILLSDKVKKESKSVISTLLNDNFNLYVLSGDSKNIVDTLGKNLGFNLNNLYSKLLPEDKVIKLQEIKEKSKNGVVYIGDGINDAPVISLANIGISMGGLGSDIAIEASDIVIMDDHLDRIPLLLKIAKLNKKILIENIILALGTKIIVMILGIFGFANLWLAIFADVGVSLLAVINASKVLKK